MTTTEPKDRYALNAGRAQTEIESDHLQGGPSPPEGTAGSSVGGVPRRKLFVAAVGIALAGLALLAMRAAAANQARKEAATFQSTILSTTPARELTVLNADTVVVGKAEKKSITGKSALWYMSRVKFSYSVDMRAVSKDSFNYNQPADTLTIKIPQIRIETALYGPRERIASLALFTTERGTGNELERVADASLQTNAYREASRPELVTAAVKSAKYEIAGLYEDALRASGRKTRVVVVPHGEAAPAPATSSAPL